MPAGKAAERIRAGLLTSVELVGAALARIGETDDALRAWARVDRDAALDEAKERDLRRQRGLPLGVLHGVPVGVDALFGEPDPSPAREPDFPEGAPGGTMPAVVERLQEAGAVVIGRTRSSGPLADSPAVSLNPRDANRRAGDPGGSAAAATGAGQVPLAVSCDSGGGVVLCASLCGVYGFRPTRGIISRHGARCASPTLDQVGVLGRDLEDVALLADVLGGYDARDAASALRPRPRMREGVRSEPPVEPDFIWLDMPGRDGLSPAAREGFAELRESLGARVVRLPAPAWFGRLPAAHRIIEEYESAAWLRVRGRRARVACPELAERGLAHGEERYREAWETAKRAQAYFSEFFHHYDALIAPAADGEAPLIGSRCGDPVFCRIGALCGLPSLCVPLLQGGAGLPIGVQMLGSAEGDDRLLRSTAWLIGRIAGEAAGAGPST